MTVNLQSFSEQYKSLNALNPNLSFVGALSIQTTVPAIITYPEYVTVGIPGISAWTVRLDNAADFLHIEFIVRKDVQNATLLLTFANRTAGIGNNGTVTLNVDHAPTLNNDANGSLIVNAATLATTWDQYVKQTAGFDLGVNLKAGDVIALCLSSDLDDMLLVAWELI